MRGRGLRSPGPCGLQRGRAIYGAVLYTGPCNTGPPRAGLYTGSGYIPCQAVLCHAVLYCSLLCTMLCHAMTCYTLLGCAVPRSISCHALCHAVPSYAMLYQLCCAIPCRATQHTCRARPFPSCCSGSRTPRRWAVLCFPLLWLVPALGCSPQRGGGPLWLGQPPIPAGAHDSWRAAHVNPFLPGVGASIPRGAVPLGGGPSGGPSQPPSVTSAVGGSGAVAVAVPLMSPIPCR